MKEILVTDSLFIGAEHVALLEAAGFKVTRLDKTSATEEELIDAIKGKAGYILGGIEKVTKPVIEAADALEVIVFTGIDHADFIPAFKEAEAKGIKILNTPEGPTQAVAEWAISMALAMNRGFFELSRTGDTVFKTTPGIEGQAVGIIGFGRSGQRIAEMIKAFRPKSVSYSSRHTHDEAANKLGVKQLELDDLLSESDIVFVCVSKLSAQGLIGADKLAKMKDKSLLVSFMHEGVIDQDALYDELKTGRLRAGSDYGMDERFNELPLSSWNCFNGSNAFNTTAEIQLVSDTAVDLIISQLV